MLVRDRDSLLEKIADMDDQAQMQTFLERVKKTTRICFLLLDIEEIFIGLNPIFNKEVFKEWYECLRKWAHFTKPEMYIEIRNQEKDLVEKLANKITAQASSILEILHPWQDREASNYEVASYREAFKNTRKEVIDILERALVKELVNRFSRPYGIRELWRQDRYLAEKKLLLTPHPTFHNKDIYKILRDISKEAPDNPAIRENFLEYVRRLFGASINPAGWEQKGEAIKLVKNKEFMGIVWKAAISRKINIGAIKSLEEYRKKLKGILKDDDILPVPKWWEDLISDIDKNWKDLEV